MPAPARGRAPPLLGIPVPRGPGRPCSAPAPRPARTRSSSRLLLKVHPFISAGTGLRLSEGTSPGTEKTTTRCLGIDGRRAAAGCCSGRGLTQAPASRAQLAAAAGRQAGPPGLRAGGRPGRSAQARRPPSPRLPPEELPKLAGVPPPQIPGAHAREDARAGAGKARPTPFAPRPARLPTALGGPGPAPSRGGQRACAVARAAVSSEGLKSAGHAQCSFWPWRGGRHIGTARGSRCGQRRAGYSSRRLRSSRAALASPGSAAPPFSGRPPALVPAAHAAAAGPRLSAAAGPGALRRGSGRRRGALAGP